MSSSQFTIASALLLLGLSTACRCTEPAEPPAPQAPVDAGPMLLDCQEFLGGQHSGIRSQQLRLVRTQAEWLSLWREHSSQQLPAPEPPKIDFESQMLIAVFLGERPTSGFGIQLQRVRALAGEQGQAPTLEAMARESRPDADTLQAQVITTPFQMLLAPRTSGVSRLIME
ncbi:MAG: hypothetical protein ACI8QC_002352 [Planctomycetota bacterium]|jgi:hypothetical protein